MPVLIGTSGWQYTDWRGAFYPRAIKQVEWLQHYAQRFRTVEINASFYRLPSRERFETWSRNTPDDFMLCPKTSRYRGSKWISPRWRTTNWGYVRFHEGAAAWPCYGKTALQRGADAIAATYTPDEDVYAFFNNDPRGCAVRDARWFAAACARSGLAATRVPAARDITLVQPAT